jgi:hypothetical protein
MKSGSQNHPQEKESLNRKQKLRKLYRQQQRVIRQLEKKYNIEYNEDDEETTATTMNSISPAEITTLAHQNPVIRSGHTNPFLTSGIKSSSGAAIVTIEIDDDDEESTINHAKEEKENESKEIVKARIIESVKELGRPETVAPSSSTLFPSKKPRIISSELIQSSINQQTISRLTNLLPSAKSFSSQYQTPKKDKFEEKKKLKRRLKALPYQSLKTDIEWISKEEQINEIMIENMSLTEELIKFANYVAVCSLFCVSW